MEASSCFLPQQIKKTISLKLKTRLCEQFVCVYVGWDIEGVGFGGRVVSGSGEEGTSAVTWHLGTNDTVAWSSGATRARRLSGRQDKGKV